VFTIENKCKDNQVKSERMVLCADDDFCSDQT
jgi:hypothetical protein